MEPLAADVPPRGAPALEGSQVSQMIDTGAPYPALGLQLQPGSFMVAIEVPGRVTGSWGSPRIGFAPCTAQE